MSVATRVLAATMVAFASVLDEEDFKSKKAYVAAKERAGDAALEAVYEVFGPWLALAAEDGPLGDYAHQRESHAKAPAKPKKGDHYFRETPTGKERYTFNGKRWRHNPPKR